MIKYSIIVCSYNRFNFLSETISSILDVLKERSDFELLIIDNNSSDETPSLKEKYSKNSNVKYFFETQQGLSYSRNRGMTESSGNILVYLDDDIEIVDDYFTFCDEIFLNDHISISGGKVIPYKVNVPIWLPQKYYFLVSVYDLGNDPKEVKYLMGGNFAIRRNAALKIGFYDTALGRNGKKLAGGEEIDYQNRAVKLGYKMYYSPKQNILHKINEKLNMVYVLSYARELGISERIIDQSTSITKVSKKIFKSYLAILGSNLFKHFLRDEKRITYLRIINEYGKGYLRKKENVNRN
ncbi:glycosyltransferase family 2 protein [Flavobacterium branchiicola]|uniref:Glycosyltransferase family 2 protein n=1 Tax=Flavobacterium branchiicola TaxID=1114875 RepID=A0ABV9PF30_9FLAO|nr:glycosyltransferase family 2 protein [Flavobacterium branchiicola]MBS7254394.1 glycosyltransferase family 2 protein [Flavobacterium branchiicola]